MGKNRNAAAPVQLTLGAVTDVGRVRKSNQDAYCALLAPNTPSGVGGVLAVADGMGGHQGGERASQMAMAGVVRLLGKTNPAADDNTLQPVGADGRPAQLGEVIVQVNREVFTAAATPETRGMGTTLSLAVVEGATLTIGHVGDSRVYLLRGDSLAQLTPDHSWVAEEVARGALTAEQARNHPRRNLITRAVGIGPNVEPVAFSTELKQGDTLLLCSDGLHGMVTDERITTALAASEPKDAAAQLVDMANEAGGTDNTTVIVARVESAEPLPREVWEDAGGKTIAAGGHDGRPWELSVLLSPVTLLLWLARGLRRIFARS